MSSYTEASFIAALRSGKYDFSGSEFDGPIRVDKDSGVNFNAISRLILDRCHLGPDFSLGRWDNPSASISLEKATGSGRVALFHMHIHQFNLSGIQVERWLAIMHSTAEVVCLAGAILGGFTTKESRGGRLDLTFCRSNQSLFERKSWRTIEEDDAELGKLTPTTLSELRSQ